MQEVDSTPAQEVVEYRVIPQLPGYMAGDDGSIWSCWKQRGRLLGMSRGGGGWINTGQRRRRVALAESRVTPRSPNKKPYLRAGIRIGGRKQKVLAHHCVLWAFVGPCPPGMECRHLDGNVLNNTRRNLAWGTKQENMEDQRTHGTNPAGQRKFNAKLSDDDVLEIRRCYSRQYGGRHSLRLAQRFGVSVSTIQSVVSRSTWRHL